MVFELFCLGLWLSGAAPVEGFTVGLLRGIGIVQTQNAEAGLCLPTSMYLRHPPQYFPPTPDHPLPGEDAEEAAPDADWQPVPVQPWVPDPIEERACSRSAPCTVEDVAVVDITFENTPLRDAIDRLRRRTRVQIKLDEPAIAKAGIDLHQAVSVTFETVSLKSALGSLLRGTGLTYAVRDGECADGRSLRDSVITITAAKPTPHSGDINQGATDQPDRPAGRWLMDRTPQYFPPSPDYPLPREVEALEDAAARERELLGRRQEGQKTERGESIKYGLRRLISVNFQQVSLREAVEHLKTAAEISIVFDEAALREAGVSLEQPMTLAVERLPLKVALDLLLRPHRLTFVVRENVLTITSRAPDRSARTVKHSVANLLQATKAVPGLAAALARHSGETTPPKGASPDGLLVRLIVNNVRPETWKEVGGEGTIQYLPSEQSLLVTQTAEVQEEVLALLETLSRMLSYSIDLTWAERQEGKQSPMHFPRAEACPGCWFTVAEGKAIELGNGTLGDLVRGASSEVRQCSAQDPTPANPVQTGYTYRGRVIPLEGGRVRLDLELQKAELAEANRTGVIVSGQTFGVACIVQLGQATKIVLQRDADGQPQSWLDVTTSGPRLEVE